MKLEVTVDYHDYVLRTGKECSRSGLGVLVGAVEIAGYRAY
jgi:hypothetical protein